MTTPAPFKLGDSVKTLVALPGIPAGSVGLVKEVGHLFLAVGFEEGRIGYYSPRQLRRAGLPASGGDTHSQR